MRYKIYEYTDEHGVLRCSVVDTKTAKGAFAKATREVDSLEGLSLPPLADGRPVTEAFPASPPPKPRPHIDEAFATFLADFRGKTSYPEKCEAARTALDKLGDAASTDEYLALMYEVTGTSPPTLESATPEAATPVAKKSGRGAG